MGPQHERDAATIDHFGREPLEHALGRPRFHLAAAQAFEATPLHLLLRRSGREDFRKPPQRLLEADRLIETIPQSRVVGRGRKRPELDRPEAVDEQLLVFGVLDLHDGEERRATRPRSVQTMPHDGGGGRRQIEARDHFLGLALIAGLQHKPAGRLADQGVAHVGQPLARKAELDVVLAALARVEFGLGAHLRAAERPVPLVIIEPFDGLVSLAKPLGVVGPDGFGNVMDVIGPQEEVAGKNVTAEQIHHLGLAIGGGRAGRGHLLKVEDDDPGRPKIKLGRLVEDRIFADRVIDVAGEHG